MYFIWIPGRLRRVIAPFAVPFILGLFATLVVRNAWEMGDVIRLALGGAMIVPMVLALIFFRRGWILFGIFMGGVALLGAVVGLNFVESNAVRPMAHAAVEAVRPSAQSSRPLASSIPVNGKIIIWDVEKDQLSRAQFEIPAALRATAQDQAVTVFLLWDTQSKKVANYHWPGESRDSDSKHPAYQDTTDIAVVSLPGPRLLGWHAVVGDKPPTKSSDPKPQHGDTNEPIARWIRSLPGVPAAPPMAVPALATWILKPRPAWTEATAQQEAVRRYPQLSVANSPMNRAFIGKYKELKATNSDYLRDPGWPLHLAEEVANQGPNR